MGLFGNESISPVCTFVPQFDWSSPWSTWSPTFFFFDHWVHPSVFVTVLYQWTRKYKNREPGPQNMKLLSCKCEAWPLRCWRGGPQRLLTFGNDHLWLHMVNIPPLPYPNLLQTSWPCAQGLWKLLVSINVWPAIKFLIWMFPKIMVPPNHPF